MRVMRACAIVALASYQAAAQPAPTLPASVIARIDSLARAQLAIDDVGGMTIGVVTDSGLLWTNSYGFADMSRRESAARSTVYRIGSITKQFTATMLLQLVQRGLVHLSDPGDRYLPELDSVQGGHGRYPPATLMQLATMTSGLAQEPDDEAHFSVGDVKDWEHVLAMALPRTRVNTEPGTAWLYSNVGYAALGAALERAAGQPYIEYVSERILKPLGMAHSGFIAHGELRARLATGYAMAHGVVDTLVPKRELAGRGYRVPNGGLFSTIDDMAAYVRFEMGNAPDSVLPKSVLKNNFANLAYSTGDMSSGYGIGFHAKRQHSMVALGHPGSVPGYLAAAYFDPVTHTGVVVLRNVDDSAFDVLGFCLTVLELSAAARK